MSIEILQSLVVDRKIRWRGHALKRLLERRITRGEVITAILNGKIIEEYTNDYPFPSCLIMGRVDNITLHIVCSIDDEYVWIITVYKPDPEKWESDNRTRKGR